MNLVSSLLKVSFVAVTKIGKLHYQLGEVPVAIGELIAYHSERDWPVVEVYGNAVQVDGIGAVQGIKVLPDKQMLMNHYWVIMGEEAY